MNKKKSKRHRSKVIRSNKKAKQPIIKIKKNKKMDSLLVWKIVLACALIPSIAIGVFATIKIYKIKAENTRIEKAISATTGTIAPPIESFDNSKQITVLFGANNLNVNKAFVTGGRSFNPLSGLGSDLPLKFTIDQNGALMVSAKFTDFNSSVVAEINNNEWQINQNNFFKRNYDSRGFEVIDKDGITKFQIEFINNEKIKIGGVFRDSHNWWLVNDTTAIMTDIRLLTKEEIIKESARVPDMFRYPADKYFGIRNKSPENN